MNICTCVSIIVCIPFSLSLSASLSLSKIMYIHMHRNAVMHMDSKVRQTYINYMTNRQKIARDTYTLPVRS